MNDEKKSSDAELKESSSSDSGEPKEGVEARDRHNKADDEQAEQDTTSKEAEKPEGQDDELEGQDDELEGQDDEPEGQDEKPEGQDDEPEGQDDELEGQDDDLDALDGPVDDFGFAGMDDAIDPELLAIAEKPKQTWHRPLIMVVVCLLIGLMMVWFRMELLYFFSPQEPIDLGEAHESQLTSELENRFVQVEGYPMVPRNQNPGQCGQAQGFPTYQRRFFCGGNQLAIPVMGRPDHDLLIQRYVVKRVRVTFTVPPEGREEALEAAHRALNRVSAVTSIRRARPDEIGTFVIRIEGGAHADFDAIRSSIVFELDSSVPHVRNIRVESTEDGAPGSFEGRVVRVSSLGSRFAAVATYLNDCTDYPVTEDTFVILDGSEAGDSVTSAMCYGQAPRQYWPYLVLYGLLVTIFILNVFLLIKYYRSARRRS